MMKNEIKLIKIIVDMLDNLTEEQLSAILEKRAHLRLEFSAVQKESKISSEFSDEFYVQLENCPSREIAQELFEKNNFKKTILKTIARHYSIPIGSKDSNSQIIDKIIETVVGSKLKFDTLLNTNLNGQNQ